MARSSGLKFWGFDVGLFRDRKVKRIKGEFGIKGVYVYIYVLNAIYEGNGYYLEWDSDSSIDLSEEIGDGCKPQLVEDIISRCIKRSLFDEEVFNMFGVLTSAAIQRRFLIGVQKNREAIAFIKEYWLLDEDNPNDVSTGVLRKLTFVSPNRAETPRNRTEMPRNRTEMHIKEKKGKEMTGDNNISSEQDELAAEPEVISLMLKDGTLYHISLQKAAGWKDAYSDVNVNQELKKMREWLKANPQKRKTARGVERFIVSWLSTAQGDGQSKKAANYSDPGRYENMKGKAGVVFDEC